MNIRAKFNCNSVTLISTSRFNSETGKYDPMIGKTWKLQPVTGTSEENKKFYASSPGGSLELYCVNPDVGFELGKDYYLDFTKAE